MNFLIISGAQNTGKTSTLNLLANELLNLKYASTLFNIINYDQLDFPTSILPSFTLNSQGKFDDFSLVIEVNGKKILFHSATDDFACIDKCKKIMLLHSDLEIIITTCRDIDYPHNERTLLLGLIDPIRDFALEIPRGRISRTNPINKSSAKKWLTDSSLKLNQYVLGNAPFNL